LPKVQDLLTGVTAMSQISKLRQSRNEWKRKAAERAEENRYLRKELARVKRERDRLSKEPEDPEESLP
jgi:predicted  nucleic acid-binding Zn-ribbon protein